MKTPINFEQLQLDENIINEKHDCYTYILWTYAEFNNKQINIKFFAQRHSLLDFSESVWRAENSTNYEQLTYQIFFLIFCLGLDEPGRTFKG